MKYQNIYQLFREQTAKHHGEAVFFDQFDGLGWAYSNWKGFEEAVHIFACALSAKGLTKNSSVAILAGNVPEWTIADVAAIAAGGVGVGIYPTSSAETVSKANAKISSSEQIKKFIVLDRDFSAEFDEITPTMKLKRTVIAEKFQRLPADFYR